MRICGKIMFSPLQVGDNYPEYELGKDYEGFLAQRKF
jgi:hypothetical protein